MGGVGAVLRSRCDRTRFNLFGIQIVTLAGPYRGISPFSVIDAGSAGRRGLYDNRAARSCRQGSVAAIPGMDQAPAPQC